MRSTLSKYVVLEDEEAAMPEMPKEVSAAAARERGNKGAFLVTMRRALSSLFRFLSFLLPMTFCWAEIGRKGRVLLVRDCFQGHGP